MAAQINLEHPHRTKKNQRQKKKLVNDSKTNQTKK
jgi:hypothetical protein